MGMDQAADSARQARWQRADIDLREVVNGMMFISSTGCQWASLPMDLPPRLLLSLEP
jgi:transposase